jgi:hypothetical protein
MLAIPAKYRSAESFSSGLALVEPEEEEDPGDSYYIDGKGSKVLAPEGALWSFSDGLTVSMNEGDMKYMDRRGRVIAPYETK